LLSSEKLEARLCLSEVSFAAHEITVTANGAMSVFAADLDGDADMDILSGSALDNTIAWYENTDGKGTFGQQRVITRLAGSTQSIDAADLDVDGDIDVLSASPSENEIAWYENTNGRGTFGEEKIITRAADKPRRVYAADLDGDGDMDVLSAAVGVAIAWYENTDGKGKFGPHQGIKTGNNGWSVHAADVDGDADMDVLGGVAVGPGREENVAWYENTDGKGTFGQQHVIMTQVTTSVYAADLDGDGDVDVLSTSAYDNKVAWYENTDGKGAFGEQHRIATAPGRPDAGYAADLDGDSDMDVLVATRFDGKIAWYENTDGRGTFGQEEVISRQAHGASAVYAADLDGDGDMDALSASRDDHKIAWYENLSPHVAPGDANRDLQFDQLDIVQVLQAAKYLSGAPATFEEGDWNGDGVFDQLDIVAALQTGNYLKGPYAARLVDIVFGQG
jgi:hypothetical protein